MNDPNHNRFFLFAYVLNDDVGERREGHITVSSENKFPRKTDIVALINKINSLKKADDEIVFTNMFEFKSVKDYREWQS